MPLVRTTQRPSVVLTVSDTELADLLAQGVVYVDYRNLYVNIYNALEGCAVDLAAYPSITITGPSPSNTVVVATTTTGVTRVSTGAYTYRWRNVGELPPTSGTYAVAWAGVDANGDPVTASDTVVVP